MVTFCALRTKTWVYLMCDGSKRRKAKTIKKCVTKRRIIFKNYTDCLFNDKTILKWQQRFKSDCHEVHTEEIQKVALSSNNDKRLKTINGITTYPPGTNAFKVCESEMMIVRYFFVEKYANCPFYDEIVLKSQYKTCN